MKKTLLLVAMLGLAYSLPGFAGDDNEMPVVVHGRDVPDRAKEALSKNMISRDQLRDMNIVNDELQFNNPALEQQIETVLPTRGGDGRTLRYQSQLMTAAELADMAAKKELPQGPKASHSAEAVVDLYDAARNETRSAFLPVIFQLVDDPQGPRVTSIAVLNKNGTLSNISSKDPGVPASADGMLGAPLLQVSTPVHTVSTMSPLKPELGNAADGTIDMAGRTNRPGTEDLVDNGLRQMTVLVGEGVVTVTPLDGGDPFEVKSGSEPGVINFYEVTQQDGPDLVKPRHNEVLGMDGPKSLESETVTMVYVLEGKLNIVGLGLADPVDLVPGDNNVFVEKPGGEILVNNVDLGPRDADSPDTLIDEAKKNDDEVEQFVSTDPPSTNATVGEDVTEAVTTEQTAATGDDENHDKEAVYI